MIAKRPAARLSDPQANSAASAAPGSAARMNASPTRNALNAVGERIRATSVPRENAAFGDDQPVGRDARAADRASSRSETSKVRRLRLLMPISGVASSSARSSSRRVVHLDQHGHAESNARSLRARRAARRRARRRSAGCSRRPARATRATWYSSTMKSLRSSGQRARGARRDQILRRALEKITVGQHRKACGAAGLVATRRWRPDRRSAAARPCSGSPS